MPTLNELIVADMAGLNEGHPHGVPSYYDFYSGPVTVMGNNPEGNSAIEWWMGMYVDAGGNPATNTIVNFRNARLYWFNTQTNAWVAGLDTNVFDVGFYAEDYSVDYGTGPTIRHESDGSISFGTVAGKVAHGYAPWPRIPFDPAHFGGVVSVLEARLILDNGAGTDDRASAKYLVSVGGDYYPSTTGAGIENNPGIAGGKLKYVTSAWQLFAMTTLSQAQLDALPALPFTFGGASTGVGGTTGGTGQSGSSGGSGAHRYHRILVTSNDTGTGETTPSVAEWKFYDSGGTEISRSGGTGSASSTFGGSPGTYDPSHAFDNDANTFWNAGSTASTGSPQWLQYQFASPVDVHHFSLTCRNDGFPRQCPGYFSYQTSDDGVTWTTVFTYQAACWENAGGKTITFYTGGLVYRLLVTATQAGTSAVTIANWEMYDSGSSLISTSTGTTLASTAYSAGGDPSGAFAGTCSSWWRSAYTLATSSPAWLAFHFPTGADVASFTIQSPNDVTLITEAPATFSLESSTDGATWTTAQTYTAGAWTGTCQTQTFSVPDATPPAPASIQVTPNVGFQCHSYTINVAGINTHFDGTTTVAISGTGATVSAVNVTSATSLTFSLALSCTATLGARTVTVTTGSEILTDAFTVAATTFPSAPVRNNIAWSQLRMGQDGRFGIGMYGASTDGSGAAGVVPVWGGTDGKTLTAGSGGGIPAAFISTYIAGTPILDASGNPIIDANGNWIFPG